MGYHVNIMQCMQLNFLLAGQVYPMLMSSVPQAWGMQICYRKISEYCMEVECLAGTSELQ